MAKVRSRGSRGIPAGLATTNLKDIAIKFDREAVDGPANESALSLIQSGAPWSIEIGTGNGRFLEAVASEQPDRRYLGIERSGEFFTKAAKRVERAGLTNVRCIHADAVDVFDSLLPSDCADEVIINFSDPWPKRRHRGRRLFRPDFIDLIEKVLCLGGDLRFNTDVGWYFTQAIGEIRRRSNWTITKAGPIVELGTETSPLTSPATSPSTSDIAPSPRVVTNFERKGRESGRDVWGFVAQLSPKP